ncbi:hypothetical protein J6590_042846 [Homalodisca vitripennis]|nr:hypothetical protein J6590_042846 [Homalodisca vitripennis]
MNRYNKTSFRLMPKFKALQRITTECIRKIVHLLSMSRGFITNGSPAGQSKGRKSALDNVDGMFGSCGQYPQSGVKWIPGTQQWSARARREARYRPSANPGQI